MPEQKEVEDVQKEFMNLLMEVKLSIGELNVKFDNITDMKNTLETTKEKANEADRCSKQNAATIKEWEKRSAETFKGLEKKIGEKADKDDVERIIKDKDNWQRNLPAWVAVAISAIVFVSQYIGG
ncbi:hypothetical protein [Halobacillus trueperi]|uniref:hypothetical protein n=1 Tax=Halobacillus trueperi TaxID=156205 RepID=UPI0011C07612|nr:hypothetical protein [Halobacillus trueperi]